MDEKIFHAVAEVLCSVLRDVEDPTGLIKIILLSYYQIKSNQIFKYSQRCRGSDRSDQDHQHNW